MAPACPNGLSDKAKSGYPVMHLSAEPKAVPDKHRKRYKFLEAVESNK